LSGVVEEAGPSVTEFKKGDEISQPGVQWRNETRTYLALEKDGPLGRAIRRCGAIIATPILSGLQHHYARI
jgi:hypothetical protein